MVEVNLFGETIAEPETEVEVEVEEDLLAGEEEEAKTPSPYSNPVSVTGQYRFCGNPLRADTYRGCTFGCKYCFAGARTGPEAGMFQNASGPANLRPLELALETAYSGKESKNINVECLRRGVPLHLGGMSDPFQHREWKDKNTVRFFQMTEKYKYPVVISTKTDHLPDEMWELLDPKRHAFQVSLIGIDPAWVRRWETNTPEPLERERFMWQLKERGFWVGLRIQPLIEIEQAVKLTKAVAGFVDYITVEHLKLPMDNPDIRKELTGLLGMDWWKGLFVMVSRSAELRTSIKEQNLERIKEAAGRVRVGAGDNDLHHLSDSRCCCGIDTMGPAFARWLKYNLTYFQTAAPGEVIDKDLIWCPKNLVTGCFKHHRNAETQEWDMDFRRSTDDYCEEMAAKYHRRNQQMTMDEYMALEGKK